MLLNEDLAPQPSPTLATVQNAEVPWNGKKAKPNITAPMLLLALHRFWAASNILSASVPWTLIPWERNEFAR